MTNNFVHLVVELDLVGQRVSESSDAVGHETLQVGVQKLVEVALEVGLGRLRAGADGHGPAVVRVGRRADLKDAKRLRKFIPNKLNFLHPKVLTKVCSTPNPPMYFA